MGFAGTRRASDLKAMSIDDIAAHAGSGDGFDEELKKWKNTLGEVPWWELATVKALMESDRLVRNLKTSQDVLDGLVLFFNDNAQRIFLPDTTSEERRKLFHTK